MFIVKINAVEEHTFTFKAICALRNVSVPALCAKAFIAITENTKDI